MVNFAQSYKLKKIVTILELESNYLTNKKIFV